MPMPASEHFLNAPVFCARTRVVYDGGSRALLDDTSRFGALIGIAAELPRPNP